MLPIVLPSEQVDELFKYVDSTPNAKLEIDLMSQVVKAGNGKSYSFDVDSFRKDCLYRGLDDIGLTLENEKSITSFEKQRRSKFRKCLKENKGK